MPLHQSLQTQFDAHLTPEASYAKEILPLIHSVTWATKPQEYLQLHKIERARLAKGRVLKAEPAVKENCYKLGYDQDGRLVYEEEFGSHPRHGYTKYYLHQEEEVYAYTFNRAGELQELELLRSEQDRPVLYGNYARYKAQSTDEYHYEEDKLVRIVSIWRSKPYIQYPVYLIAYDELDQVASITRTDEPSDFFPNGQEIEIYRKNAYSIKQLTDLYLEELLQFYLQELSQHPDKQVLLLTVEQAFNSDQWLPFKAYFADRTASLAPGMTLSEYIDLGALRPQDPSTFPTRLLAVSNLLMQEAELKEKYDLPYKTLIKAGKQLKEALQELNPNMAILVMDMPDDLECSVQEVLLRVYNKKEIREEW